MSEQQDPSQTQDEASKAPAESSTQASSGADASTAEPAASGAEAGSTVPSEAAESTATSEAAPTSGAPASSQATQENSTTGGAGGLSATGPTDGSKAGTSEVVTSHVKSYHSTSKVETAGSKGGSQVTSHHTSSKHHSTTRTSSAGSSRTGTSNAGGGGGHTTADASSNRKRAKLGELDLASARIGFLGAGKVAESTINGLIHYGKISPSKIYVAAPSSKGLERFKTLGCHVTKRNYDIFGRYDCDIVFLAFHGYVIKHCFKLGGNRPHPLCTNYIPHQRHPVYILSLVSGVSMGQIRAVLLNPESPNRYVVEIHRLMVNTAVGHGLGLCAIDCEPDSKKLSAPIRQLLSSIAHLEYVPATQMDAACAIGGSGLAFSYYFINALADGAFRMGLSRAQAIRFASKTAQCAAQTMLESGKHPAELRDNVSAPSGAAIYGIHVLEKNDVASGVTAAVEAAHKRAHDLATQDITQ